MEKSLINGIIQDIMPIANNEQLKAVHVKQFNIMRIQLNW